MSESTSSNSNNNSSNNNNSLLQVPSATTTNNISSSSSSSPTLPVIPPPVIDIPSKKEKTMAEFLATMDNYAPIIPDAVTDYYLNKAGFNCDDVRIKRLLALATQKFVADIATDAFQYCKVRQSGIKKSGKERKNVLTMEDLSAALNEYGINIKKPEYYS
ncbi:transcription initiation factor TFIID 23-30kDa subunit-domain-containing protein [Cokeromyces recurvatus]|uniref:transcription initiation factor TFIID 23-30kDa subunit-domain-containing protein n=1 Tax=Cokeromyces recurvatus TaxID=90255 RepID=UPI00221F5066|nr:transcription initiation factor TFIID 23-30kDa subunit-domain-containing protein [Cokeromyces recurvatus]KAI7907360.1 transcription initiation factor TFIID 23-30kDa subunit-domain-containing protein [Cokeromyces recurvatus]